MINEEAAMWANANRSQIWADLSKERKLRRKPGRLNHPIRLWFRITRNLTNKKKQVPRWRHGCFRLRKLLRRLWRLCSRTSYQRYLSRSWRSGSHGETSASRGKNSHEESACFSTWFLMDLLGFWQETQMSHSQVYYLCKKRNKDSLHQAQE